MDEQEHLKLISSQMENIRNGLRSITYYRILSDKTSSNQYFWTSTKIAHLGNFLLSWAKNFGAFREDLHWRYSILKPNREIFRKALYNELGTDKHKFREYLKSMLALRNELIAHKDLKNDSIDIPDFDMAIESSKILYRELQQMLLQFKDIVVLDKGPASIDMWLSNLLEESAAYIETAVVSTNSLIEYQ